MTHATHEWGAWSAPYQARWPDSTSRRYPPNPSWDAPVWQERSCPCGNREWRSYEARCPDSGYCHHDCRETCWRVKNCGPLSGAYPHDDWPVEILNAHVPGRTVADFMGLGAAVAVAVETFQFRCHLCGKVKKSADEARALYELAFHYDRRHKDWTHR